jgi:hypothetical protein
MNASGRVQRILAEIRELTDDEKLELETELLVEAAAERAWGAELDRRAARVLAGEASGVCRDEVRALLAMPSSDARARLAARLDAVKRSR